MIGWWTSTAWMVQGISSFTPMYFNSALLFVLLGAGSLCYVLGLRKIASIIALIGGLFALLLFIQRVFEFNWGLDHLFFTVPEKFEEEFQVAKCGLNTLFSFICIFSSLVLISRKKMKTAYLLLIGIFSGLSLAITIVAFWGYVSGMESAYSWGDFSRMAFLTAVGLAVASLFFLISATKILTEIDKSVLPIWSAALVGMVLFSTTIAFTRALSLHQTANIQQTIEDRVHEHSRDLEDNITNITSALDRLGKRDFHNALVPNHEWKKDTSNYLHDLKGLVGVVKLSENGQTIQKKWSILTNRKEIEKDIKAHEEEILHTKKPILHLSTFSARPHLIYVAPRGEKDNHQVGVISLDVLLNELIPKFRVDQTALIVTVDGTKIYETNGDDTVYKSLESSETIPIFNTEWKLTFWPTTTFIENEMNYFPLTAFLFGSVISMFVALLTYLAQKSFEESRLMASRNLARSAFLAQVSHELRTPLSGIIASVDILENTTNDPKQMRLLDIMRSSGQHLLTVINEVLDLAKLEAGKIPLEPSSQDINQIAKDLVTLLLPKAQEKGLFLHLNCNVPKSLMIDPTRLRQILSNLIGNGIKFTEKGGVTVDITYTQVLEKGKLQIDVEDTGIGISKEDQDHLFEKFSSMRKSGVQGTGLGLYITRAVVEIMGGSIFFTSTLEVGSTFTVILPVTSAI